MGCGATTAATERCSAGQPCTASTDSDGVCQANTFQAACKDNTEFRDSIGESCSSWVGYTCGVAEDNEGWAVPDLEAISANCPLSCGTCVTPTTLTGNIVMNIAMPENVTVDSFIKDPQVKTGVAKGIASKLTGITHDIITVMLSVHSGRRLNAHLSTNAIKVDYTIKVQAARAVTAQAAIAAASNNMAAWGAALTSSISTETSKAYVATVTSIPAATSSQTFNQETSGAAWPMMSWIFFAVSILTGTESVSI